MMDLTIWARHEIRSRRRARTLRRLNRALLPVCCLVSLWVAWEVWRAL